MCFFRFGWGLCRGTWGNIVILESQVRYFETAGIMRLLRLRHRQESLWLECAEVMGLETLLGVLCLANPIVTVFLVVSVP